MANWNYTIDVKNIWSKYSEYSRYDYDQNTELFKTMKKELVSEVTRNLKAGDLINLVDLKIISRLKSARRLSSFNNAWNSLYDYCDAKRIWLATNF